MWRGLLWLSGLLLLALSLRAEAAPPPTRWTFLLYMNADCGDGTQSVIPIVEDFAKEGSTAEVQIIAFLDQGPVCMPVANLPSWQGGKLLRVHANSLEVLPGHPPSSVGTDDPEPNLGDSETLAWFLEEGLRLAGGDHVALLSVSHGGPWRGLGADDTSGDGLTFVEYGSALARVLGPLQRRLGLLGLIHCGTSCMEGLQALAPYSDWILASEDQTEAVAVPPAALVRALKGRPVPSPEELGRLCVDLYHVSPSMGAGGSDGIALIDCAALGNVRAEVDRLAGLILDRIQAGGTRILEEVRTAKLQSRSFACCVDPDCLWMACTTPCQCCQVDLLDLAWKLSSASNPEVAQSARCLVCRLEALVPSIKTWEALRGTGGVSIYMPCTVADLRYYASSDLTRGSPWLAMLQSLLQGPCQGCGEDTPPLVLFDATVASVEKDGLLRVSASTVADVEGTGEAWLLAFGPGSALPVLTLPARQEVFPGSRRLSAVWDWTVPCLVGGAAPVPVALRFPRPVPGEDDTYVGEVPMRWSSVEGGGAAPVEVFAQVVLHVGEDGNEAWIRRLRPGPGSGRFTTYRMRAGDTLSAIEAHGLSAPVGEGPFAAPSAKLGAVPPPLEMLPVGLGALTRLGFALRDGTGRYHIGLLPWPVWARRHPAAFAIPK